MGIRNKQKKEMKRRFDEIPKEEQEQVELEYHRMGPREFDELMSGARKQAVTSVRLPPELVKNLKAVAELEGESSYQSMIKKWIEERLKHETKLLAKLAKRRRADNDLIVILEKQPARRTRDRRSARP